MGKTYRREKDPYNKRDARDVVTDKQKLKERERARQQRDLKRQVLQDD